MMIEPPRSVKIFYSYAHEDKKLRDELAIHLRGLQLQGLVTTWYDREIFPGTDWKKELNRQIETASIVLLLISVDFIRSDYCYGIEMERAMERHEHGEARVIPVILRPVDWHNTPFGKLRALPREGPPITSWPDIDEAFFHIASNFKNIVLTRLISEKKEEGDRFSMLKQYEEALHAYEEVLQTDPHNLEVRLIQGYIYQKLHRYEEAVRVYDEALRFDPNDITAHFGRGEVLGKLHQYEEAMATYDRAFVLSSQYLEEIQRAISSSIRTQHFFDTYENTTPIAQDWAEAIKLDLTNSSLSTLGYEEALLACNRVIYLDPNDSDLYIIKGDILFKLERYQEALFAYEQAIRFKPDFAQVYIKRAMAFEQIARNAYKRLSKLAEQSYKHSRNFSNE